MRRLCRCSINQANINKHFSNYERRVITSILPEKGRASAVSSYILYLDSKKITYHNIILQKNSPTTHSLSHEFATYRHHTANMSTASHSGVQHQHSSFSSLAHPVNFSAFQPQTQQPHPSKISPYTLVCGHTNHGQS